MVLAVDLGLGDKENIVQEEFAKVRKVMSFPILNTLLERLDRAPVLDLALRLVRLVRNTLGNCNTLLEFRVVGVCALVRTLDQILSGRVSVSSVHSFHDTRGPLHAQ